MKKMNFKTKILSERIKNSSLLGGLMIVIYLLIHEIAVLSGWLRRVRNGGSICLPVLALCS